MTGLGIVDVVPEESGLVALDEFAVMGIGVFTVGFTLRLNGFVIGGNTDRAKDESPIVSA